MARIRAFGLAPGRLTPGPHNAITDVPGVKVGHTTLIAEEGPVCTGVTAILPHDGNLFQSKVVGAVHTINGFGKPVGFEQVRELGTIETPILLTNTLNVGLVTDALTAYMLRDNPDIGLSAGSVNPLVGETNDGFLNDIRGRHVHQEHVWQALDGAAGGAVAEGNVGAGTGTSCFQFKGGIGTASRLVQDGQFTVGALVQTNFGRRNELTICGIPVGQQLHDQYLPEPGPGSIMIVLATDTPLDSRQLGRLTHRAAFGLARTGSTCHHGSGDFVIAFSVAHRIPHYPRAIVEDRACLQTDTGRVMDALFLAVIESVEESILNALCAAETMTGRAGHTLHAIPHERLAEILAAPHGRVDQAE